MLVLSNEPKAVGEAAKLLREKSPNIAKNFKDHHELATRLHQYIAELRKNREWGHYISTSGFTVMIFPRSGEPDEVNIFLNIADLHDATENEGTQQFVHTDGEWINDDSVNPEWGW